MNHRLCLLSLCLLSSFALGAETRSGYDSEGRLLTTLVIEGNRIVSETSFAYDRAGRQVEKKIVKDGHITLETRAYQRGGLLAEERSFTDNIRDYVRSYEYRNGRLVSSSEVKAGAAPVTTHYEYDLYGRLVLEEVRDSAQRLVSKKSLSYPAPAVPIAVSAELGGAYQSDVDSTELALGFGFVRKPKVERYGADPLELRVSGSYKLSRSKDEFTNKKLTAGVGVDYNYLLPRTTFFHFSGIERNPVANLELDLEVAPIGVKLDLADRRPFELATSFAPVWNYRVLTGDTAPISRFRGSFRGRASYSTDLYGIYLLLEYLPELAPATKGFADAWTAGAVVRTTTAVELKLNSRISLKEEVKYTRDRSLIEQASDCDSASPGSLCGGYTWSSLTSISIRFDVLP